MKNNPTLFLQYRKHIALIPQALLRLIVTVLLVFPSIVYSQWSGNPVIDNVICNATGDQINLVSISDGAGGAIFAWQDKRNGSFDIYAQRVNAKGVVQWAGNGEPICSADSDQINPAIITDGSEGAIIAWQDKRSGNFDIYAQHINVNGVFQWNPFTGDSVCKAVFDQVNISMASDGNGGALLTWEDYRSNAGPGLADVYAQKLSTVGAAQWIANGIGVCIQAAAQRGPKIISDGNGGAFITWYDQRAGDYDIYAQRVSDIGGLVGTTGGVAVCTSGTDQTNPVICSDGGGGAIIVWQDFRSTTSIDIWVQSINAAVSIKWPVDGVVMNNNVAYDQIHPQIVSDGAGGALMTWEDFRTGVTSDIYAQRVQSTGVLGTGWNVNGVAVCVSADNQSNPKIISDGNHGAIISWEDKRSSGTNSNTYDVYTSRITGAFALPWTANGVPICIAEGDQTNLAVVTDTSGGAIVAWQDKRSGNFDIYGARVLFDGSTPAFPVTVAAVGSGSALSFDGTDDYVTAENGNMGISSGITVEAWVKTSGTNNYSGIVTKSQGSQNSWKLDMATGGKIRFDVFNASTYGTEPPSSTVITDGIWHHVAGTYDGSTIKIYVDGVLNGSSPFTGNIRQSSASILIGNDASVIGRFFNGQIDEVRIWNVARTQSQIQTNMYSSLPSNTSGLVAYWRFDEGAGAIASDVTGGQTGTLLNGTSWIVGSTAPVGPPVFSVTPTSIVFGNVPFGTKTDYVTVTNTGYQSLLITNVASDNPAFSVTPIAAEIASHTAKIFSIVYTPTSTTAVSGHIVFTYNAAGSPYSVNVSGTGSFQSSSDAGCMITFDGVNDYAIGDTGNLNVISGMTIEAWVKTSGTNNYSGIVTKAQGSQNSWKLNMATGGKIRFDVFNASAYGTEPPSTAIITDGIWHHIAGTYDGSFIRIYVDGILNGSSPFTGNVRQSSAPIVIGNDASSPGRFFNGQIDEVRIWNIARTPSQIQVDQNSNLQGNETNLVSYYRFDDCTGLVVGDGTGNGNNATLVNGPSWSSSTALFGPPHFFVSPSTIVFGTVTVGIKTDSVTVTNTGYAQLIISAITSSNPAFFVTPVTATLASQTSQKIYITYSPTNTAAQSGSILFTHNASTSPDTVVVSGVGAFQANNSMGNALSFDGVNDYVSAGTGNLSILPAITVEAWVKINAGGTPAYSGIVTRCELASLNQNSWKMTMHGTDRIRFDVYNATTYAARACVTPLSNNVWYHVAGTYDGAYVRFYLNGICEDSIAFTGNVRASSARLMFGNDQSTAGRFFKGEIDEVRIWNIARTSAEISSNMNVYLAGNESGLVAYYRFDEGYRTLTGDGSGNGNFGTLVNGPLWVNSTAGISKNLKLMDRNSKELPTAFALLQNYPNPFNPVTTIRYELPEEAFVSLKVYDLVGNEVRTLESQKHTAGVYEVQFDASELSSGVYVYRIIAGNFVATRKLLFLK